MARPITLHAPLTPVALATKLRDTLGGTDAAPKAGVCGHGSEDDMMLFVYRPNVRDSFAVNLTATMTAAGGGTTISGKIGTPASGAVFLWVWFGFLTVFFALSLFGLMLSGGVGDKWPVLLGPLGMMALGGLIWRFGTWNAKTDEAAILAFLSDTVEAKET